MLQRDLARIERYYRGRGFLDAHARAARVKSVGPQHVRIDIVVEEGAPTVNREVGIDGLEGLPKADADLVKDAARSALPLGDRFDEDKYKQAQETIRRALTDHGYAYATVKPDAKIDLGSHAIDYVFTVTPGIKAVFGPLTFVGLDPDGDGPKQAPFEEAPLRRAVNIKEGKTYSEAAVELATTSLLQLQVFSSVHVEPDLRDPNSKIVPLVARVEPQSLRRLRVGGGLEFDAIKTDLHAVVGWEDHNFFGGLRDFHAEVKPGVVLYPMRINNFKVQDFLPEARVNGELDQPGFLEAHTVGFVSAALNAFPLLVDPNPPADIAVPGYLEPIGSVGLKRNFGKHFSAKLDYNVQIEHPFHYGGTPPLDPNLQSVVLLFPRLITAVDFRDDAIHPHKGVYFANDLEVAGVPGTSLPSDLRVQPDLRGYIPLARGVTLALRATVGFVFAANYGSQYRKDLQLVNEGKANEVDPPAGAPVPPPEDQIDLKALNSDIQTVYFRGFYAGGPDSNRGFPYRAASPYGVVPFLTQATAAQSARNCQAGMGQINTGTCTIPIGGFSLWEFSAEARFDVAGPLGVALFCDASNVSPNVFDLDFTQPHLSCGAGARYDTPVGPIRLDFGYRVQPLQVLGYPGEGSAAAAVPTYGQQATFLGGPFALSFGIGEAF